MDTTSSTSRASSGRGAEGTAKVRQVAIAVDQPHLDRMDPESIRIFLRRYDAYCREVKARASQLVQDGQQSLEPVRPIGLKYCIDSEQLESAVELGLIPDCNEVNDLTDEDLRIYLDTEATETATVVTADDIAQLVSKNVRMEMTVKSAKGRMKLLFMSYKSLLRQQGMQWVVEKNPKVAVRHVLSVIKPAQLKSRIEQDLGLAKAELKHDFKGFMKHCFNLSDAFEKVDNGNPRLRQPDTDGAKTTKNNSKTKGGSDKSTLSIAKGKDRAKREPPSPCPLSCCAGKTKDQRMHWVDDCPTATNAEKKAFKDKVAAAKASDGPARSTRSQASSPGTQRHLRQPRRRALHACARRRQHLLWRSTHPRVA